MVYSRQHDNLVITENNKNSFLETPGEYEEAVRKESKTKFTVRSRKGSENGYLTL